MCTVSFFADDGSSSCASLTSTLTDCELRCAGELLGCGAREQGTLYMPLRNESYGKSLKKGRTNSDTPALLSCPRKERREVGQGCQQLTLA